MGQGGEDSFWQRGQCVQWPRGALLEAREDQARAKGRACWGVLCAAPSRGFGLHSPQVWRGLFLP